ncbi:hypothetical protein [Nocardia jiangxiensis]|uniref:DUF222 domain-containing protein n=1 Tax=Nocardia jiangxiensis TaxID=282685 RepID=A0ABW6SG36_9NOCA|nr:hypothetical protein [Nocardia jiangxiensis]
MGDEARLIAQDRVIDSLTGYVTAQVTTQLARAVHDTSERAAHQARVHEAMTTGETPAGADVLREWDELPERQREAHRLQARRIGENLAAIGCFMAPVGDPVQDVVFTPLAVSRAGLQVLRGTSRRLPIAVPQSEQAAR